MRIAVLITGQARHIQQSGFWNREKVFPKSFDNIKVDYYVYLWDDGSDDLADRIVKAYDPVKFEIGDYNEAFHHHRHQSVHHYLYLEILKTLNLTCYSYVK